MSSWLTFLVLALSVGVVAVTVVLLARDRSPEDATYALLAVTELALLAQAVWAVPALSGTTRDVDAVTFVGYLAATVVALPLGALWSLSERNRAGTAVLLVAGVTVLALQLRLDAIWAGAGA